MPVLRAVTGMPDLRSAVLALSTQELSYIPTRPKSLAAPASSAPPMHRNLGIVAIIVSASLMGLAGVLGRLSTPSGAVIGSALTFGRMLVGAIGMLVILAVSRRLPMLRQVRLSWSVVLGGIFLGLSLATYLSSTVLTDLARAVALHYLGPVVATVLAWLLLKERPSGTELVSLSVSFVGMMLAAGLIDSASAFPTEQRLQGDILAAVSGVLYGAALLCYRYRSDMPADVRNFWNFVFGGLGAAAMVAITRPDMSGMTTTNWAWAAVFFVVCGLLAWGCWSSPASTCVPSSCRPCPTGKSWSPCSLVRWSMANTSPHWPRLVRCSSSSQPSGRCGPVAPRPRPAVTWLRRRCLSWNASSSSRRPEPSLSRLRDGCLFRRAVLPEQPDKSRPGRSLLRRMSACAVLAQARQ